MFVFFINGLFYSFWQNKKGDIFFDLTCVGLDLEPNHMSLYYYQGVKSLPSLFAFDESFNLLIQEKEIIIEQDGEVEVEVEVINTVQTINAIPYVINGQKLLPC
jgi:hypothetical protein